MFLTSVQVLQLAIDLSDKVVEHLIMFPNDREIPKDLFIKPWPIIRFNRKALNRNLDFLWITQTKIRVIESEYENYIYSFLRNLITQVVAPSDNSKDDFYQRYYTFSAYNETEMLLIDNCVDLIKMLPSFKREPFNDCVPIASIFESYLSLIYPIRKSISKILNLAIRGDLTEGCEISDFFPNENEAYQTVTKILLHRVPFLISAKNGILYVKSIEQKDIYFHIVMLALLGKFDIKNHARLLRNAYDYLYNPRDNVQREINYALICKAILKAK